MSDDNGEWLSALVDGELQGKALESALDALRDDPQLLNSWQSYHVVRDAVSSNLEHAVDLQLHQRGSDALKSEPTVLAPQRRSPLWLKQVAGLAIAASVTGIAIVTVQSMNETANRPAAVSVAQQDYLRMEPARVAQGKQSQESHVQANDALDAYLVNHNEYSANSGIQGVLPYVRIVGHTVGQ